MPRSIASKRVVFVSPSPQTEFLTMVGVPTGDILIAGRSHPIFLVVLDAAERFLKVALERGDITSRRMNALRREFVAVGMLGTLSDVRDTFARYHPPPQPGAKWTVAVCDDCKKHGAIIDPLNKPHVAIASFAETLSACIDLSEQGLATPKDLISVMYTLFATKIPLAPPPKVQEYDPSWDDE